VSRTATLIEPYCVRLSTGEPIRWCVKRVTEHWDQSRTTEVLFTAATRPEVADWLAARHREAKA
jgi:hypothetical protein